MMHPRKGTGLLAFMGSGVALFGAAMSPCCFPLLAVMFGFLGTAGWQSGSPWVAQVGAILAVFALFARRRSYGGKTSAIMGTVGAVSILLYYHLSPLASLVYAGILLLFMASLGPWMLRRIFRLLRVPILRSVLTCPVCGKRTTETMPQNSCLFFWVCPRCESRIRPLEGDCCVFCSYGNVPCPSIQLGVCSC